MLLNDAASALLAFADREPNTEALELAPVAGWIMLFCAMCAISIFVVHRETWRRVWLRAEDPRVMGLFRIVFGVCVLLNINGLSDMWIYLFTDEGLFLADVARQVFARDQFSGFGNGMGDDPYGFFDAAAVWQWLKGPKYSLLFFWGTPKAFYIHLAAFEVATLCLIVGFKTRYTKWLAWFFFLGIIGRNSVFWEGTENVYRTFFFYLCLSRCGHAYSVDNWLRCRKLRKQSRLSGRDDPGCGGGVAPCDAYPDGLEPIYRLIPAWPRLLVVLQVAAIYCVTGVVKNGPVWWNGDAFYYALNLDHFWRVPPQQLSAWFGTTLFRLNTHIVHFWEAFFPLVVFGLFVRFALRERPPAPSRIERRIHAAAWIGLGLGGLALSEWLMPVHFVRYPKGWVSWFTLARVQTLMAVVWILGMLLVAWGWYRLRHKPWRFKLKGREFTMDLDAFCRWFCGRRVWLWLGFAFQTHVFIMMSVGWFQAVSLSGFIAFLNGGEVAMLGRIVGRNLSKLRIPGVPAHIAAGHEPWPAADPALPGHHTDGARMPGRAMVIAAGLVVAAIVLAYFDVLSFGWSLIGIAAFLAGAMLVAARSQSSPVSVVPAIPRSEPDERRLGLHEVTRPWAYGPFGRFVASCVVIYHITGVAGWLLPAKDSLTWRSHVHQPFKWWLRTTQTTQGWRMFAPNPPRSNLFLRVLVTDSQGEEWDMRTDVYDDSQRPIPWIFYTRQRKVNRRVAGGEGGKGSWYQKWHARYFCRKWILEHDGEVPRKVELVKITYSIPRPEWAREHGPYDPAERLEKLGKQKSLYTARCKTEVGAQPPNALRERYGLEPVERGIKRWSALRRKQRRWERKREREAAEKDKSESKEASKSEKGESKEKSKAKKDKPAKSSGPNKP